MLSLGWYKGRGQEMFKGLLFFFLSTIDTKHSVPQNQKLYFNSFYLAGERLKGKIKALRFVRITRFYKAFSKELYFWLSWMITHPNFCSAFNRAIYTLEFTVDIAWGYYYFPSWVCLFAGGFFFETTLIIFFKHLFYAWGALKCSFCFLIYTKWQYGELNSVEENLYHTNPEKEVIFLAAWRNETWPLFLFSKWSKGAWQVAAKTVPTQISSLKQDPIEMQQKHF